MKPGKRALLLAAAGLLLGGPVAAQLELRLASENGSPGLRAGESLELTAALPARSDSGLAAELPAIYIDQFPGPAVALSESACEARVQGFESKLAFNAPMTDLLAYQLATLSDDGVVTVLDPRGGFGASRMLARLELGGPTGPLLHDTEARRLWVSVPKSQSLAVIDTADWKVLREIPLGSAVVQLGHTATSTWALTTSESATALWTFTGREPGENNGRLELPHATTQVLFAEDSLFAIAGNRLFNHRTDSGWQDLEQNAASMVFSEAAAAVVVLSPTGDLALLETTGEIRAKLPAARAEDSRLDLSPDGRWALVWTPEAPNLRVADLARQSWRGELRIDAPTEIVFTERFFYVRSSVQAEVLVTPLSSLETPGLIAGKLVAGGTRPHPTPRSSSMVSLPGGGTVFWASATDQQIYAYHEGMNAAAGSLQHPKGRPVDLLITGPLLRKVAPGAFAARLSLPRPGRYLIAGISRTPYAVSCRIVDVVGKDGEELPQEARLANFELPQQWPARKTFRLRFDVEQAGGKLPQTVPVLVMSPSGTWQGRFWAKHRLGASFEAEIAVPAPGPHFVLVRWEPADGRAQVRRFGIEILPAETQEGAP